MWYQIPSLRGVSKLNPEALDMIVEYSFQLLTEVFEANGRRKNESVTRRALGLSGERRMQWPR